MKALKNHPLTVSLPGSGNLPLKPKSIFKSTLNKVCITALFSVGILIPKLGFGQLNGTYTIDPGKSASTSNYMDIRSAICDMDSGKRYDGGVANGKGINGAVVFKVADGTYDEQNTITSISGSSLSNTVTFTSASGDSSKAILQSTFSSSYPEYILTVSGASNIIISKLTFDMEGIGTNSGSPGSYAGIYLSGAVNNVTVTHCVFFNNCTFGPYGIYSIEDAASDDSNKVFTNNYFNGTMKAIYMALGSSSKQVEKYTVIAHNISMNGGSGFYLYNQDQCTVDNNTIGGPGASTQGIYIYGCSNLKSISGNAIFALSTLDIINTNGSSSNHALISNNAITSVNTGINISGSSYCDVFYNNIFCMYSFSNPLCINVNNSGYVNIVDNAMETDSSKMFNCIWIDNKTDISECDYNDYYSYDSIGKIGNSGSVSLSAWQSASGFDKHSLNINPKFHLYNGLKSDNAALLGNGESESSVSTDILGQSRSTTMPTIGAYEYINTIPGLAGTYTINPNLPASSTNYADFKSAFGDLMTGDRYDGIKGNGAGVNGPVTFKITDGNYSNPGNNYLGAVPGSSAKNTVTFTSASGDSSKAVFSSNFWILSHSKFIILSKLGIKTDAGGEGIVLGETQNITITHCMFQTNPGEFGILGYDNPGAVNTDINNNNFEGGGKTIFMDFSTNISITDNLIQNAPSGSGIANGRCTFIDLPFDTGIVIRNNTFLRSVDTAMFLARPAHKVYITGNRIMAKVGVALQDDYYGDSIVNNTISASRYGIIAGSCNNLYIISNNLYADSAGSNQKYGGCIWLGSYDSSIVILNNNIENGKNRLGIYSGTKNQFKNLDYNNYYFTDSIGFFGKNFADLTSLQKATGFESHGLNINPDYNLSDYLRTGNTGLANKGIPVGSVIFDITGNVRNSLSPSIGAYELQNVADSFIDCSKSCIGLKAPVSGRKYLWSTGDTTRDITFCPSKSSIVSVKIWTGISSGDTTSYSFKDYITVTNCVWPGDANNDGKADINDVLNVGIAYGDLGSKRPNASTSWTGQPCPDWISSFQSGANHKSADCNGDGIVDSTDLSPIYINFSKKHNKAVTRASGNPNDPPLSVKFSQDSVQAGDSVTAIITLGSSSIKAYDVYGITISVNYGNFMLDPKSIIADFNNSWMGTIHKNMIDLVVNDTTNKIIYIGITRTDHNSVSGAGEIGALSIYMPDNVAGKREVKQIFDLIITDYKSITAKEADIPLNPVSDSILVYEFKSGINTGDFTSPKLNLYPNPAYGSIRVSTGNTIITGVRISDIMGKTIIENSNINKAELNLQISELHSGIYFMDVITKTGTSRARFVKE